MPFWSGQSGKEAPCPMISYLRVMRFVRNENKWHCSPNHRQESAPAIMFASSHPQVPPIP